MHFKNREEAARLLAIKLGDYKGKNALVLGIPRGALPMAKIISDELNADLDVVLVHKLSHPLNEEYAIGSIDEEGHIMGGDELIDDELFKKSSEKNLALLKNRRKQYTPIRPKIDPKSRVVIIVDDGIATGWTLKAAIKSIRQYNPKKIIAAIAVGPHHSISEIRKLADEVVCLYSPQEFYAVGQFFDDFSQVSDEEVIEILKNP